MVGLVGEVVGDFVFVDCWYCVGVGYWVGVVGLFVGFVVVFYGVVVGGVDFV